jgi:hypothetical protein
MGQPIVHEDAEDHGRQARCAAARGLEFDKKGMGQYELGVA